MTKPTEKKISFDENQTSSAATHYEGGADQSWLSKVTPSWFKLPSINIGEIADSIKKAVVKGIKGELIGSLVNYVKTLFGKVKSAFGGQLKSVIKVGSKILGTLDTTPAGQGLRLFGVVSGILIGGATLAGVGPEVIMGMLRTSQLLYLLNLKETDEQINQQIEGSITSFYSEAGQAFGTGLASFVTGGVFQLPRVQIDLTKISILWRGLNEEARSQMLSQLKNLARTAFFTGLRMMVKIFYRDTRKWLKTLAKKNPDDPLIKLIPGGAKAVELWGSGGEPWSVSLYVQKEIQKIQENKSTKNIGFFLEQATESFGEGLQEFLPQLVRQPIT